LVNVNVIEAFPKPLQLPLVFALALALPLMTPVTLPDAHAVPVTLALSVVDAEPGTKKLIPLPALLSV
jgi:hypothetical protein